MRYLIIILSFLILPPYLNSQEIDTIEARRVAWNAFYERTFSTKAFNYYDFELRYRFMKDSIPFIYVFDFARDTGYILVTANKFVPPVIGYSTESGWNPDMPPQMEIFLEKYIEYMYHLRKESVKGSLEAEQLWNKYSDEKFIPEKSINSYVNQLLTTTWDQNCYYNESCPSDPLGPCGHVYAGCVATAMGQIMKYWNYPVTGNGTKSYTDPANSTPYWACNDPSYGTLTVNFGNTTYNWIGMPNSISGPDPDIATLLYHAGISVYMDYSYCGSGASSYNVPYGLIDNFKYFLSAQRVLRSSDDQIWISLLKSELDLGRPLYYSGKDTVGRDVSHAFVVDGYNAQDEFHINWGWGGLHNNYFALGNFRGYNLSNDAVIKILPPPNISGPGIVCAGSTNTYSINPSVQGGTYTWSIPSGFSGSSNSNSINLTAPSSGSGYKTLGLTITKSSRQQTFSKQIWLGKPADPSNISFRQKGHTCYFEAYISPVSGVMSYEWSENGTIWISTPNNFYGLFDPYSTVTVYVRAKNNCGTSATKSKTQTMPGRPPGCIAEKNGNFLLSEEKYNSASVEVLIFPNPSIDLFSLELESGNEGTICITDVSGKIIYEGNCAKGERKTIFCKDWSKGIYIVRISNLNWVVCKKLIIQ